MLSSRLDAYISRYGDFCANNDNNDDTTDYFTPCACAWGNYYYDIDIVLLSLSSSISLSLSPSLSLSLHSGGTNYVITGKNFDSVQEPRLLVYYDGAPVAVGDRRRRQIMQEGARFVSEVCTCIVHVA